MQIYQKIAEIIHKRNLAIVNGEDITEYDAELSNIEDDINDIVNQLNIKNFGISKGSDALRIYFVAETTVLWGDCQTENFEFAFSILPNFFSGFVVNTTANMPDSSIDYIIKIFHTVLKKEIC